MMPRCIGISALLALGIACSDQPGFDSYRERAAKIGHREYQNELGKIYQVGSEGETNFISALKWYIAAATPTNHVVQEKENLIDIVSRYKLKSYQIKASNKGLDLQNLEVGTKLTIPGLPEAMYNAGALYEIGGNGVDRNFAEAAKWYHHGAEAARIAKAAGSFRMAKYETHVTRAIETMARRLRFQGRRVSQSQALRQGARAMEVSTLREKLFALREGRR